MAMLMSAIRDEVRENLHRKVTALTDARIEVWINWVQRRIADVYTWEEMREVWYSNTVADQSDYGFPTRMKDIFDFVRRDGSNSIKLTYVPARHFDEMVLRPLTDGTGRPTLYVDYGTNFELYKIPDSASYVMRLRVSLFLVDMSASDSSELLDKDHIIVSGTTAWVFMSLRELEDAGNWDRMYVAFLK